MSSIYSVWMDAGARLGAKSDVLAISNLDANLVEKVLLEIKEGGLLIEGEGSHSMSSGGSILLRARAPVEPDFFLNLSPWSYLSIIARGLFRAQDINIGDEDFDRAFVIKSNDERMLKHWLSEPIRLELMSTRDTIFTIENGVLQAEVSFSSDDDIYQKLKSAIWSMVLLGNQGTRLLEIWQDVADQVRGSLGGRSKHICPQDTYIETNIDGIQLRAELVEKRGLLSGRDRATRISAQRLGGVDFSIAKKRPTFAAGFARCDRVLAGCELLMREPEAFEQLFSTKIIRDLESIAPREIYARGNEIELFLDGLVLDLSRLITALQLTAALARTQPGTNHPYR